MRPLLIAKYVITTPLDLRAGVCDGLAGVFGELLEVVPEHPGELTGLPVVGVMIAPRRAWIEERRVDARYLDGNLEAEERVLPVLDAVEISGERRAKQGPRGPDGHALALAEWAARPARVDEPDVDVWVLVQLLAEHVGVDRRRLEEERRAEAGREGRLRLCDADLGARQLRREAGQEVEDRLLTAEAGERWEDPEGVGGEEDDRARVARALFRKRVGDLFQLVSRARVLGLRVVVEVEDAALVDDHVLEHRSPGPRRRVDLRLRLLREPDHLGIAAALEVEDPVVAPAVLVVADQSAFGIGRQRGLAGPREPEEDRDTALVVDVRRAVHRNDAVERKPVVQEREDGLLDLARVEGAADQHLGLCRVEDDEGPAAGAVRRRIGLDGGRMEDERLELEVRELIVGRIDEERLREERMPGAVGDHAEREAVGRVGAREGVDDVQILPLEVRDHLRAEAFELLGLEILVDLA